MKDIILWTLSCFGLIYIVKVIWDLITEKKMIYPSTSLVITVYNWEENVERLVRSIASQCYFNQTLFCPVDVLIIDMGSTDNTYKILQKLGRQFSFLKVLDGEYIKKSKYTVLDYTKDRCQGEAILLIDATTMDLEHVQKLLRFYFNENDSSKVPSNMKNKEIK